MVKKATLVLENTEFDRTTIEVQYRTEKQLDKLIDQAESLNPNYDVVEVQTGWQSDEN